MLLGRSRNGRKRNRSVEGYEPTSVLQGEGQQVGVGYLAWPMDPVPVDPGCVEQAHRTTPEFMVGCRRSGPQPFYRLARGYRARVRRLTNDPDKTVLGYGARCPTVADLGADPFLRQSVIGVITVEQSDEDIDV